MALFKTYYPSFALILGHFSRIIKLNYLKEDIKEGDRILVNVQIAKKMETTIENVINNNNLIETFDIPMDDNLKAEPDEPVIISNHESSLNEYSSYENFEYLFNIDDEVSSLTKETILIDLARTNFTEKKCVFYNKNG